MKIKFIRKNNSSKGCTVQQSKAFIIFCVYDSYTEYRIWKQKTIAKKNHNLVLRRARILILFSIANKQQRQQCVSLRRNQHVHEPFGQSSLLIIINNSLMMMVKNLLKKTDPTNVWTMLCTILFVVILVSNTQWQLATATTKDIIISLMYVYHSFFSLYLQHHNIINHIEL